ncbi:MYND-type zinc finger-containing chromatin reader ZMYND8-like isoform X4 [Cherax quadricarinatus]
MEGEHKGTDGSCQVICSTMSELKAEHDSTPLTQDTIAEEDDNLSDMGSHTGSERDAMSEAGSETPSMSDKSSLRNNHSASNTPTTTRSTRSRDNPEFAAKQKVFMAKVQAATAGVESVMVRPETPGKRKRDSSAQGSAKKRKSGKVDNNGQDYQNDNYCWECHREGVFICCEMCPRVFHLKCAGMEKEPEEDWACSECHAVMQAENIENRSRSMQLISVEQLCTLLKFALNRLKTMPGMEPFTKPVDTTEFPTYEDIVVHPVDFMSLERNIKRKFYGSTEAFSSDARWIVHNSVIFNGANSKVSSMARTLVKILKQEMSEIETCPDCYMNAHQNPNSWFTEACRSAHPLIWARLKGFPFWPAKAVKWRDGNVDVRFFGRHDRSWVPMKECFLFSEQMPTPLKNRNKTLESCLQEVNEHIVKLRERFGRFKYAPHRVQFNPADPDQIKIMLPNYKGPMALRVRSQSRALSRLSGHSDDETSSIGSTDSGASVRRRKRESGTSSATQGTETEVEIPNSDPVHGDHHNMTRLGDEERFTLSQEHIKREVKDERQKDLEGDEEEEEEDSKINVKFSSKTGDDDSDEEMENCDKYPGGNYEDDENFDEEDDSSIVNGKTLHPRTINDQSEDDEEDEEEDEENYTDEYPSNRKRFLVDNLKDGSVDEMESKDASEDEDCEKDGEREEKIDNAEEQEEEIGNLALNTGEEVQDKDGTLKSDGETLCDIKNDLEESVSEMQDLDKEIKAPENVASKVWPRNEDILNLPDIKPFENDSEMPRSRERQVNDDSDSEMAESEKHNVGRIDANRDQKLKEDDDDDGESENEGIRENARLFESDNTRTAVKEEDDTSNGGGKTEFNNITSDVLENLEKECKKELSESEDSENEDETKNKRTFLEKMESDSESDKSESESENKFREKKMGLDESDDSDKSADEDDKETSMDFRNRTESEDEESDTEKRHFGKEVRETCENDSENSRSSTGSDSKMVGDSVPDVEEDEDDTKIVKKSRSSDEQIDVDSKSEELNNRTHHSVKDRVKEEIVSSEEIERKMERDSEDSNQEDKDSSKNSLFDAVQLMKTMGTIAITRLDGKSLERGNSNNGVTISLAKEQPKSEVDDRRSENEQANRTSPSSRVASPVQKLSESRDMEQHISSLGCSVSVTKAVEKDKDKEKEKEKVKMPSGVDTTRLSPSISIIPMSGGSDRQRTKTTIAPSASPSPSRTSPSVSAQHAPRSSPSVLVQNPPQSSPSTTQGVPPRVSSSSSSSSPQTSGSGIPPPPPLSHPQASAAGGVGSRGVFGPPPPGSQVLGMGGARGPIMATPGMRMMGGGGPGMMVPSRIPGGPPTRHLPPEAGPLSAQLHKHSQKLAEVMRATLEDVLGGLVMTGTPEARVAALQLELERTNWRHQQELAEVRHNADVMLVEMRANLEAEKQRAVEEVKRQMEQQMMEGRRQMERQMVERLAEVRRQMEAEKQRAVEETKKKQWCANCGKEALFFCCWNTSYCDYPCQQSHWPQHMSVCGQNSDGGGGGDGGPDSVNGEASGHSSRVSTPVQNLVAAQFVDDEGVAAMAEEHRRRKHREDDVGSLTSSILAQCLIKGNRDRPRKKPRSSTKSSGSSKEKDSASNVSPKAPKSPKAWMDWFLEQSGAEGIKENLQVTPKTTKTKTRKSGKVTDGSRKKRKSTPCVRRKIEHILKPEEVTEEMLNRVATKPKEKTHDQENGTSCHQCRQKTSDTKTICRSGKCVGLRGFFCGPCLRTRYGEDARKALLDPDWCCPVCRGICNCSLCRKAFGQQAVGQIVQRLGKMGYSSVQQYLDSKSSKEEKPEIPIKPVEDKQSQLDHEGDEESQDVEDMKEEKPELVGENDEESLLDT